MRPFTLVALVFSTMINHSANAEFELTSSDIQQGKMMSSEYEFQGFGCSGGNLSPQLSWSGAPEGTKSFAVLAYDPDAPTGSGWWHWQLVNIPTSVSALPQGAGGEDGKKLPEGARQIKNDYGQAAFGGACPPQGHGTHRYQFSLHALKTEQLELPADPSSALVGYMVNANSIGKVTIEALYKRD